MRGRSHINGRHFDLMRAVIEGKLAPTDDPSVELLSLVRWGYVIRDGNQFGPSNAGKLAWETWQNMEIEP